MSTHYPDNLSLTMHNWMASATGQYIRAWEEACFCDLTADIFGFHALQIGFPSINTLQESRIKHLWLSSSFLPEPAGKSSEVNNTGRSANNPFHISVIHKFEELPFASHSIDLVILPHVLEFAESPHQILREVERILVPEGQLIISGFNPASLLGIRQTFGKLTGAHFLPECAEFISLSRIKDWLKLLNLETNRGHFGFYMPPCRTEKWLSRFSFLEKTGDRWWPYLGAVYIVQAIKQICGMRLVGPVRTKQPAKVFLVPANNQNMPGKHFPNDKIGSNLKCEHEND